MKFCFNEKGKKRLLEAVAIRLFLAMFMAGGSLLFVPQAIWGSPPQEEFPVAGERQPAKTIWVVATAYSSDVRETDDTPCIPANGYDLCVHYEKYGFGNTIAANFLPLETQVKLPALFGDQIFVVRDRMNERYGPGRIDIWTPSRAAAKEFGVKYVQMEQFGGGMWRMRLVKK